MEKLSDLLSKFEDLTDPLDFEGVDLNFDHYMEIYRGNDECIFGFYWLASRGHTGHAHIVLVPVLDKPVEEWPVAYYDDDHGTAYTFASSIKTWFPAYLIYEANTWYPIYLEHGYSIGWVEDTVKSLRKNKKKIIKQGTKFMPDFEQFFEDFLLMVKKKEEWDIASWYKRIEPDSFITEYHNLKAKKTTKKKWKEFIIKNPYFNLPLFEQLYTEEVQYDDEFESMDKDLCWEFWTRQFKMDMPYYKLMPAVCKQIVKNAARTDSAFMPFIEKIHAVLSEDEYGYYHGTEIFFELGTIFEKAKDYKLAIRCFENAILQGRGETEEYHLESYDQIAECAQKLGDINYLAYLEETEPYEEDEEE